MKHFHKLTDRIGQSVRDGAILPSKLQPRSRDQLEHGLQAAKEYLAELREALPSIKDDDKRVEYYDEIAAIEGVVSGLTERIKRLSA